MSSSNNKFTSVNIVIIIHGFDFYNIFHTILSCEYMILLYCNE